jgi:uncharacterized protein (TIGR02996 family)
LLGEPPGTWELCPVCWWEDVLDEAKRIPTHELNHAQTNYAALGACDPRWVTSVRPATADEARPADWKTIAVRRSIECAALVTLIEDVFRDVRRDGGTTLHQAAAIDDWEDVAAAELRDPEVTWQEIPDTKLADANRHAFLDAKGYRFYLPAYLRFYARATGAGEWWSDEACFFFSLRGSDRTSQYEALDVAQARVVAEFLRVVGELDSWNARDAPIYLEFWRRFLDARPPAEAASNLAIEAAILSAPDARDGYLVYGDWLQQRGDPRGELVAVQLAREDRPDDIALRDREAELVARATDSLLDAARGDVLFERLRFTWRRGFLHGVTFLGRSWAAVKAYRELVGIPQARFVRELSLHANREVVDAFATAGISPLLRRLVLSLDGCDPTSWIPPLHVILDILKPVLDGAILPGSVSALGLLNAFHGDEVVAAVARSRILPRLANLDLSHGTIGDEGAQTVLADAAAFAHLETLDLSHNYISRPLHDRLSQVCAIVDLSSQRSGTRRHL